MFDLTLVDYLLMGFLGVGLLRGISRGLSGELARLLGLAAAIGAAWYFRGPVGDYVSETTTLSETQADTLSLAALMVGGLLIFWALMLVLKKIMEFSFKGPLERLGGALLGVARAAVVLAIVLILLAQFAPAGVKEPVLEDSRIGRQAMQQLLPVYEELVARYPQLLPLPEPGHE
jgi:membrane protein required for colicin V production